jgi:4-amino-4-deoxy-L-arabinose transferase-like glycosyltransferase
MAATEARAAAADRAATLGALLLAALATGLVASSLDRVDYATTADEAHYLGYMIQIEREGIPGLRGLFQVYATDPNRWLFPNPLRAGFILVSAGWAKLRGPSYGALSELSLLSYALSILVVYALARRFLGNPCALAATALVAFSPLWMALGRRALADGFATLTALLAIWAFLELLRRPEPWRPRLLFMLAFAVAVLAKETTALLLLPFGLYAGFELGARRTAIAPGSIAAALLAPLAFCGLLWLLAAGQLGTLLRVVEIILRSPESNPYANLYGGGPWYRYVIDFLLLSPWPTLLAIGALFAVAVRSRSGIEPLLGFLAVLTVCLLAEYSVFTKNVRYLALLELPLRVFAAWAVWELIRPARPGWALAGRFFAIAMLCWADYRTFHFIFVSERLYDPVSTPLLLLRGLIPQP